MAPNTPAKVVVVEDDGPTRELLVRKINAIDGFHIIAAAADVASANHALASATPDILLCDLQLPDGNGVEIIRAQARAHPDMPIMVISVFGDESRVIGAIEAGARGYLLKDDDSDEIEAALKQLLAGGSPISPAIARHLIQQFQQPALPESETSITLSERELEVLNLAAKGFSYQETAEILDVSINTVSSYTKRVYTKLAVRSRSEAVFEATRLGLMRHGRRHT